MITNSHSHTRTYFMVFGALLLLTGVTVGISYMHLGVVLAVIAALFVASIKGSLVAAYFMHLKGEHRIIFVVLAITFFFFAVMLLVPLLASLEDYRVL